MILSCSTMMFSIYYGLDRDLGYVFQGKCGTSWTNPSWKSQSCSNICWLHDILLNLGFVLSYFWDMRKLGHYLWRKVLTIFKVESMNVVHMRTLNYYQWFFHSFMFLQGNLELFLHPYPSPYLLLYIVFSLALLVCHFVTLNFIFYCFFLYISSYDNFLLVSQLQWDYHFFNSQTWIQWETSLLLGFRFSLGFQFPSFLMNIGILHAVVLSIPMLDGWVYIFKLKCPWEISQRKT